MPTFVAEVAGTFAEYHKNINDDGVGNATTNSQGITIMDGSMGRQLSIQGLPCGELFHKVWSASALVVPAYHEMVVRTHMQYIEAGASLLTTNAYGVQPNYYKKAFPNEDWYSKMLCDAELAAKLAVEARNRSGHTKEQVRIFGCLPPVCESHNPEAFFEYLKENGEEFVRKCYRQLGEAALKGGSDALMLENPVCLEEGDLMLQGVRGLDVPLILSFEGAFRGMDRTPEPMAKAPKAARLALGAKLRNGQRIEALGFSCTEPETILEALRAVKETPGLMNELESAGIKLSVHANLNDRREAHKKGFQVEDAKGTQTIVKRRSLVDDDHAGYVEFCREAVDKYRVAYVGGCCGCGHEGIQCIAEEFGRRKRSKRAARGSREELQAALAPEGKLRVGINFANKLLVQQSSGQELSGVAPGLGHRLAEELGVECVFVTYPTPGAVVEDTDSWDVAFIGADPARAKTIAFSDPYSEIPCSFLVPNGDRNLAALATASDVLNPDANLKVASFKGAAYDLWLERNLPVGSTLVHADTWHDSVQLLRDGAADVLAGVVGFLEQETGSDSRILAGDFMVVSQAIGIPLNRSTKVGSVVKFLRKFVRRNLDYVSNKLNDASAGQALRVAPAAADPLRVTVLGCGAMGSIYAALFASAGNEVTAVDLWGAHVDAINASGLRVEGASGDRRVQIRATSDAAHLVEEIATGRSEPSDLVVIATKAQQVPEAVKVAAKLIEKGGPHAGMLLIQNGLGPTMETIVDMGVDPAKVMLGIASNFGARMCGPGHAEHKSMNLVVLGEMISGMSTRLAFVEGAWARAGFTVKASADIHAQMWQKLLCNCAFSGTSVCTGLNVGQILDCPESRRLALACALEAGLVAKAKGIDFGWTLNFEQKVEEYVLRFGSTVRDAKPSALQDVEAGRICEIDAINGAIPAEAAKVGLQAPTNQIIADLVRAKQSLSR